MRVIFAEMNTSWVVMKLKLKIMPVQELNP